MSCRLFNVLAICAAAVLGLPPAGLRAAWQAADLLAKNVYDIALFCYSDVRRAKAQGLPVLNLPGPM